MGRAATFGVIIGVWTLASAAAADPSIEIRGAAARVRVVPEARSDVVVTVVRSDPRLPLRVRRLGDRVYLTGDVARKVHGCRAVNGQRVVAIWGRGAIGYEQLPELVIRTPMTVRLIAGEAVFGEIGRSGGVDFTNQGCGEWTIADVAGRLHVNQAGSGDVRTGSAGPSDLSVVGWGDIVTGQVRGGLRAVSSGSGDIKVASVSGPVDARIAGSGDIVLANGAVDAMTVSIAGSGAVTLRGQAKSLRVTIAGSGDVNVAKVTGAVSKQVFGAGAVRIGH
jgi:hypothetical protein